MATKKTAKKSPKKAPPKKAEQQAAASDAELVNMLTAALGAAIDEISEEADQEEEIAKGKRAEAEKMLKAVKNQREGISALVSELTAIASGRRGGYVKALRDGESIASIILRIRNGGQYEIVMTKEEEKAAIDKVNGKKEGRAQAAKDIRAKSQVAAEVDALFEAAGKRVEEAAPPLNGKHDDATAAVVEWAAGQCGTPFKLGKIEEEKITPLQLANVRKFLEESADQRAIHTVIKSGGYLPDGSPTLPS